MKYNIILRNGRYALLEMETQYVVVCGFDETLPENQQWTQCEHYSHWNTSEIAKQRMLSAALDYYRTLTEIDYVPRCWLIEDDEGSDDSPVWGRRSCLDCPPEECTGRCMSCYYRPV